VYIYVIVFAIYRLKMYDIALESGARRYLSRSYNILTASLPYHCLFFYNIYVFQYVPLRCFSTFAASLLYILRFAALIELYTVFGKTWQYSTDSINYLWIPTDTYGYLRMPMDAYGCLRIPTDAYRYLTYPPSK
jgi:hypothetical protein